jgi:hypothetical protein
MKSALIVWGGWEGHEPKKCVDVFIPFLRERGFQVEVSNTLDAYLDEAMMKSRSLIVQAWTMGTITQEQEAGLLRAVRGGVGIAGWHGGWGTHSGTTRNISLWSAGNGWHIRAA